MKFEFLLFECDQRLFGVRATQVTKVTRMVALSPMPHLPENVLGIVNVHGVVLPVVNTRKLLGLTESQLRHFHYLVFVHCENLSFALPVDRALDLRPLEIEENPSIDGDSSLPTLGRGTASRLIEAIVQLESGMVQLLNLDCVFPEEDKKQLLATLPCAATWGGRS